MVDTLFSGSAAAPVRNRDAHGPPELVEWLRTGRLTLVDQQRKPVPADEWSDLPAETRARALADFRRLVGTNTKAAVIFLRD